MFFLLCLLFLDRFFPMLFCVQEHCCILYSILGWNTIVGPWTRVEGTPFDPNPNKPFAKLEIDDLFLPNGRLSPSITIIGICSWQHSLLLFVCWVRNIFACLHGAYGWHLLWRRGCVCLSCWCLIVPERLSRSACDLHQIVAQIF